jgi:hypothetical protein
MMSDKLRANILNGTGVVYLDVITCKEICMQVKIFDCISTRVGFVMLRHQTYHMTCCNTDLNLPSTIDCSQRDERYSP